jgi:hypothetical protein
LQRKKQQQKIVSIFLELLTSSNFMVLRVLKANTFHKEFLGSSRVFVIHINGYFKKNAFMQHYRFTIWVYIYIKKDVHSNEAIIKYLFMCGASSSILVHDFSWLYDLFSGEIELQEIVNGIINTLLRIFCCSKTTQFHNVLLLSH